MKVSKTCVAVIIGTLTLIMSLGFLAPNSPGYDPNVATSEIVKWIVIAGLMATVFVLTLLNPPRRRKKKKQAMVERGSPGL